MLSHYHQMTICLTTDIYLYEKKENKIMSQLANLQKEKDNLTSKIENINDDIATVNANIERLAKDILLNAIITGTEVNLYTS